MTSVDVVVPCYNYARYLPFAVESVLSQRGVDVRVLILDDKSPDNTPEVARALAAADSRVEYRRNEANLGLIGTSNAGIMGWAKADFVVLLSADDALTPGSLARAVEVFEKNPDVGLVIGRCLLMGDDSPDAMPADILAPTYQVIPGKQVLRHFFNAGNPTPSPSVIARTKLHHEIGGYTSKLKHTSDMEMWMRFAARADVGVMQDEQAFYRLHRSNMSEAFVSQALRDRQQVIETCEEVANVWRQHIPEAQAWLRGTRQRLADEAFWLAGRALVAGDPERLRTRLDFARKNHPYAWRSPAAWRFNIKRMIGAKLWNRFNGEPPPADAADPSDQTCDAESAAYRSAAGAVGWWPEPA